MLWSRYQCIDELRKEHRERMDEKLGRLSQQMEKELSEMRETFYNSSDKEHTSASDAMLQPGAKSPNKDPT